MDTNNPDLENFRRQWQEEVTARIKTKDRHVPNEKSYVPSKKSEDPAIKVTLPRSEVLGDDAETLDGINTQAYHDLEDKDEVKKLGSVGSLPYSSAHVPKEPRSALEHYERAIEREDQGKLGDSLKLYRQAFRLDAGVDRVYKNKYFSPSTARVKPANPNPSNAPATVPNTAHHSLDGPSTEPDAQLIASFSTSSIAAAPPPTEGSPAPPCPIAGIPSEILIEILFKTAIADIASFARLSVVCKRLAYLVATEDRIWERICFGHEYGFAAMHYIWASTVAGLPLPSPLETSELHLSEPLDLSTLTLNPSVPIGTQILPYAPPSLVLNPVYPSYKSMLRIRPRIRFNGCYISTVNYHRPGASSAPSTATYTSPVHIVTYYRYLRFFRDGTCASLLTTAEPADVVHHLTKENLHAHHNRESMLPSAVMRHALKGRWKLSGSLDPTVRTARDEGTSATEPEGDVHIETEGVDPKYMYKLHLSLRSAGRAGSTRNNKLVWKGFWSHNRLTDDWAAFTLRNDRAFFWSRVRSYGMGW
ncbi:MAG: hypothetical protein LQ348_004385 [Seirophora lacunosa]|nr:MAG: hypothetical protein LQ344_000171 [Seirophora lacunosa]KAI4185325.1 MAG: hypothetical protein LQ348_004385 [Seirophora lacunosa]